MRLLGTMGMLLGIGCGAAPEEGLRCGEGTVASGTECVPVLAPDSDADSDSDTGSASETATEPSCDLDGDGHDAVSCGGDDCNDADPRVRPDLREDESWFTETVDRSRDTGEYSAIAVGPDGTVHVT